MIRSGNPALKESTFLDLGSGAVVSRDGESMPLNGTIHKTGALLLLTVLTAVFAWSQS
ncbi:membrane protein, partial [Xanthomonas hyacinthi DSM 19077]